MTKWQNSTIKKYEISYQVIRNVVHCGIKKAPYLLLSMGLSAKIEVLSLYHI